MLRALALAVVTVLVVAVPAKACLVSDGFTGTLFDNVPANAAPDDIVLDVDFSWQAVRQGRFPDTVVTAHVRRVVRGEFHGSSLRVGLGNSSCDYPFIFGRRGLLIGHLVTPEEGRSLYNNRRWDIGSPEGPVQLAWPYSETVFVPMTETVGERRRRTGRDGVRNWPN